MAGTAFFTRSRGRVTTTFDYASTYLRTTGTGSIDPFLPLLGGGQYVPRLPGAFGDSAPDRWGRNLIAKRERAIAAEEGRRPRSLDDVDYLLGVSDHTRQGALRYRAPGSTDFLGARIEVPRQIALPHLLRASDEAVADTGDMAAVKMLLDAGTGSLGGARPKAAITLEDGGLGLAKFPHAHDEWDVMAWEATALSLAERAGLSVPWRRLVRIGGRHVLVLRRFDRGVLGERIGYMSAMSLVGADDGADSDYDEVASRLADTSSALRDDRADLFDRVALSIALHNTDDHLRNLGLLDAAEGWRLSPVFDINPNPDSAASRRTSIRGALEGDNEVEGLLGLAEQCDLRLESARDRLERVVAAVSGWRSVAREHGIADREAHTVGSVIETGLGSLRGALRRPL